MLIRRTVSIQPADSDAVRERLASIRRPALSIVISSFVGVIGLAFVAASFILIQRPGAVGALGGMALLLAGCAIAVISLIAVIDQARRRLSAAAASRVLRGALEAGSVLEISVAFDAAWALLEEHTDPDNPRRLVRLSGNSFAILPEGAPVDCDDGGAKFMTSPMSIRFLPSDEDNPLRYESPRIATRVAVSEELMELDSEDWSRWLDRAENTKPVALKQLPRSWRRIVAGGPADKSEEPPALEE
jgi:hypothetical protein